MEQQLLEQLVDVYSPEAISWWPLAPGWWILIVCSLLLIIWACIQIVKKYRSRYWKKEALQRLEQIRKTYTQNPTNDSLIALMQLIKSIVCSTTSDSKALSLVGADFLSLVENMKSKNDITHEIKLIGQGIYQIHHIEFEADNFDNIRAWIKGL